MQRLIQNIVALKANLFARNVATLGLGTAVAQTIGFVTTPILARIFSPADFGVVALFTGIAAVCATIATLRYEFRIVLPKSSDEAEQLVAATILTSVAVGSGAIIISYLLPRSVYEATGFQQLGSWLPTAILSGIAIAVISTISNWLNRRSEYRKIALLRLGQSCIMAACGLAAGALHISNGLLYAQVAGLCLALALFGMFGMAEFKRSFAKRELLEVLGKHRSAPKFLLPTALLDVVTTQLPFVMISNWASVEAAGHYRMAYALLNLPASLVGAAVGQVFFQKFSSGWPDATRARALLLNTWKALALLGLIPLLTVIFFGPEIFGLFLGAGWVESGRMAAVLAPMAFLSLLHSPTSTTVVVMGMERKLLYFGIAILIYRPLALYVGLTSGGIQLGLICLVATEALQMAVFQFMVIRKLYEKTKDGANV